MTCKMNSDIFSRFSIGETLSCCFMVHFVACNINLRRHLGLSIQSHEH